MLGKFRNLINDKQAFVLMCVIAFIVMLVIGAIIMLIILFNLQSIGMGCLILVIPLFLLVVMAILAKKYLFGGAKK